MTFLRSMTTLGLAALMLLALGSAGTRAEDAAQEPKTPDAQTELTTPANSPDAEPKIQSPRPKFTLSADKEDLKLTDDISVAEAQVAEHPDDPEAHFLLSAAYSRTPQLERAFKHLKKTKELLKAQKDFEFIDRTIGDYKEVLETNPDDTVVLYRLALGYFLKGYSIEKYPHHFKKGPTGSAQEYYDLSKGALNHLIALDAKDTCARNILGYVISENGRDLTRAIDVWQESLKVDRDKNPGAYLLLSQAYLQKGDIQNALLYGAKGLEVKQRMGMTLP